MAKDKLQKRKEALARQYESLLRNIKNWSEYMTWDKDLYHDEVTMSVYESNLVRSAHAAHCDRNGNYLDHRFYKTEPMSAYSMKDYPDPFEYALHCKIYSLEEMKEIKADNGQTLYRIAYGTLSHEAKERKGVQDVDFVIDILARMRATKKQQ
jgi:hypothetical protein